MFGTNPLISVRGFIVISRPLTNFGSYRSEEWTERLAQSSGSNSDRNNKASLTATQLILTASQGWYSTHDSISQTPHPWPSPLDRRPSNFRMQPRFPDSEMQSIWLKVLRAYFSLKIENSRALYRESSKNWELKEAIFDLILTCILCQSSEQPLRHASTPYNWRSTDSSTRWRRSRRSQRRKGLESHEEGLSNREERQCFSFDVCRLWRLFRCLISLLFSFVRTRERGLDNKDADDSMLSQMTLERALPSCEQSSDMYGARRPALSWRHGSRLHKRKAIGVATQIFVIPCSCWACIETMNIYFRAYKDTRIGGGLSSLFKTWAGESVYISRDIWYWEEKLMSSSNDAVYKEETWTETWKQQKLQAKNKRTSHYIKSEDAQSSARVSCGCCGGGTGSCRTLV